MSVLRHGEDYLVDFFQFLSVARSASDDKIKSAIRDAKARFHPDRNVGFKASAEHQYNVANMSECLLEPASRAVYEMQLNTWQGPISTDGYPVIGEGRFSISVSPLFEKRDPSVRDPMRDALLQSMSGYDPKLFKKLEAEIARLGEKAPEAMKAAWRSAITAVSDYSSPSRCLSKDRAQYYRQPSQEVSHGSDRVSARSSVSCSFVKR